MFAVGTGIPRKVRGAVRIDHVLVAVPTVEDAHGSRWVHHVEPAPARSMPFGLFALKPGLSKRGGMQEFTHHFAIWLE